MGCKKRYNKFNYAKYTAVMKNVKDKYPSMSNQAAAIRASKAIKGAAH